MKVRELMTKDAIAVTTDTPLRRVVELMTEHHVHGLPVTAGDGTVVGVITECNLVARADAGGECEKRPAPRSGKPDVRSRPGALVAGELMTSPAFVVDENDEVGTAARLMSRHGLGRLPVTSMGKLCGILSRSDVLRVFLRADEDIKTEIERDVLCNRVLDTAHDVRVEVQDGVVSLHGTVARRSTADVIRFHVMRLDGVVRVVDHLLHGADDVTAREDCAMTATMGFGPRSDRM
jgi:CBS domain-containing protein